MNRGFAPIEGADARVLVLGTLPSVESLRRSEYYANPRNAFWTVMGHLFDAGPNLPYAQRRDRLVACGVAVWDVLSAAEREGSLDSSIDARSAIPNDIGAFIAGHPELSHVFFNGASAEALFLRLVQPTLRGVRAVECSRLPSTSPANAAMSVEQKIAAWTQVADALR